MLNYVIPLIGSFFSSGLAEYFLFPFIALMFLCTVPVLIRDIFLRRSN